MHVVVVIPAQYIAQEVKRSFHSEYDFVDGDLWRKMPPRMLCTANYPHVDVIKCGCSFCPVLEYVILRGASLIPSGHFGHLIVQGLHKSQLELDCTNSLARATMGRSGSVLSFQCSYQRIYLPPIMTIGPQRQAPTFLVCCLCTNMLIS